ncbi:hypothetical protein H6G80_10385 [Nostoc sp. FACHB-87]|uniref:hypothetical protein n=1 Tax=Nostocales TaxID=1161 RepID=UPI001689778C|nr:MULTISPECIES: hypothetical protein [Nostocales]MBD2454486.1 hypothetical protein [Nostoc sp. FACHB-87]MBD2474328.1 hypothetical protein [Anabaena sp. FACHB-83]MBD2487126.1 hypothetical protein [Aulosira sp. FACHB-615]
MQILKTENKKSNILPLFAVATFGLNIFALLLLMFHGSMLQALKQQLTPQSLVQLIDGQAVTVDPKPSVERYPETIRRFVGETISLMLTWSEQQPPQTAWDISSQMVSNNIKQKLLLEITSLKSGSQFQTINKGSEYVLVIDSISQPTKITEGTWKVEMYAHQLSFTNYDKLGVSSPFNKQILVQVVDEPLASLPDKPLSWDFAAYRLGEARLQIYNICDIKDKNCS